ncbi:MAG: hypothetical protein K2K46_12810 [Lachnospiraceae bacterium]|nr:hypothetical protein [Lachnospiraceae bacterium]
MRKRIAFVMVTSCVLLMVGCGDLNNAENLAVADSQIVGNTEQTDIGEKAASENIDEGEDLEAEIVKELTMEVLLELYENDALTLKVEDEGLDGFLAYENMKPASGMEDSLTGLYICELVYPHTPENGITSDRNYELQLSYWRPETAEEYGHTENEIDNIRLMEKESQDAVLLYEVDERFTPTKDLQGFLQRDYGMEQYLICDLLSDFTLGDYREDIGFCSGWLLEGEAEEPLHDERILEAWYCPGGIGRGETASQILMFESGTLTDAALMMNHTEQLGETEILEGCEVQALLMEYAFDLFTASGWGEDYLSQHPGTEEVLKSHYWYVFMGKEDSEIFYVLFLNQEHFTKDDVIHIAQSVKFTEMAF